MFQGRGLSPDCLAFCKGQSLQLKQCTLLPFHTKNEAQMNALAVKKHKKDNVCVFQFSFFRFMCSSVTAVLKYSVFQGHHLLQTHFMVFFLFHSQYDLCYLRLSKSFLSQQPLSVGCQALTFSQQCLDPTIFFITP